eukprot:767048-Hanusia_phi.AAC.11
MDRGEESDKDITTCHSRFLSSPVLSLASLSLSLPPHPSPPHSLGLFRHGLANICFTQRLRASVITAPYPSIDHSQGSDESSRMDSPNSSNSTLTPVGKRVTAMQCPERIFLQVTRSRANLDIFYQIDLATGAVKLENRMRDKISTLQTEIDRLSEKLRSEELEKVPGTPIPPSRPLLACFFPALLS